MTTDPQFVETQPQSDFKAKLIEESRQLLEAKDVNRVRRQKLLNDCLETRRAEILNTSIGK